MNELQEAPASVTYNITSPTGFNALFTVREMNGIALLEKMVIIEKTLTDKGYKPQVRGFAKKEVEYVEGKKCPKCGGRLIEKISQKTGKKYQKCENGKFFNGVASGCDYVDWLEPKIEFNKTNPYDGETIPIEEYDTLTHAKA